MDIIVVSARLAKARSISISPHRALLLAIGVVTMLIALSAGLGLLAQRFLPGAPADRDAAADPHAQSYLRDSLKVMSAKLGEMQGRLLKLNSIGERVSRLAGLKPKDLAFDGESARGGSLILASPTPLSMNELQQAIDRFSRDVNDDTDKLGVLEAVLTDTNARKRLEPSAYPVAAGLFSSNFGWRLDPFTGQRAFHEGVDFTADEGTTILAAASGIVVTSEYHAQYGNVVEIDHGNDLVTRYGHASARFVKVGDLIQRGTRIGEVGNTGRSTGAHLHFEVRQRGVPQDPTRFLQGSG